MNNLQSYRRIGQNENVDKVNQKIKKLFYIDLVENIQTRKNQFISSIHPDPKKLIKEGYIIHSLPLRNCDWMKIHNYPKRINNKNNEIQEQQYQHQQQLPTQISRIMTAAKKERSKELEYSIIIDDNSQIIANLPAFYTKNQQINRLKQNEGQQQNYNIAMRIRSLSRVKDTFLETKSSYQRCQTPYKRKKYSFNHFIQNISFLD